jgi:hypothetical protein
MKIEEGYILSADQEEAWMRWNRLKMMLLLLFNRINVKNSQILDGNGKLNCASFFRHLDLWRRSFKKRKTCKRASFWVVFHCCIHK